jgi:hypothetical protein
MSRILKFCFILVLLGAKAYSQPGNPEKLVPAFCLTQTEVELGRLINEYRAQKGLPKVKLSVSLSWVARTHASDKADNFKDGTRCNMHSWSSKGSWSSCCYTPDHKQAQCMWDKPRELTNYEGDGYEISFWSTARYDSPAAFAKDILDGWKKSPGHNDVITNKSIWKNVEWQAMGVGIHGEYADVWFGKETDSAGEPGQCE